MSNEQLACTLASIILADANQEITVENIQKVLKAAGVEVKPQWPLLFSQFLGGKNVIEMLTNVGSAPAAAGPAAGAVEDKPAEEEKKEKTEEDEIIGGFGFGDSSSSDDESSS